MLRLPNDILGLIVEYSKGEDVITFAQTGYFGVFEKILRRHVRSAIRFDSSHNVTDAGLEHLKGVHTIILSGCDKVTDAGLEHLKGAHTISLDDCPQVTNDYIMVLRQSGVIVRN